MMQKYATSGHSTQLKSDESTGLLQTTYASSCKFLLFLHHNWQVSLRIVSDNHDSNHCPATLLNTDGTKIYIKPSFNPCFSI